MSIAPEDYTPDWMDTEASKKLNGIYVNRVYVQPLGEGLLRLNFGEVLDEEPSYHTALVVSANNAVAFAELIYRVGLAALDRSPIVQTNVDQGAPDGDA